MSLDRPGGQGDRGDRDPARPEKAFPGAPEHRPYVPPPTSDVRSWDEIRAEKAQYKTQSEYEAALNARREGAAKEEPEKKAIPEDSSPQADVKPDARPDVAAALRKRIADLEVDKARLAADNKQLRVENAGIRTEISALKAAGTERDWRDKARDAKDKIRDDEFKELVGKVNELGGSRRNEGIDKRTGGGEAEDALREAKQSKRRKLSNEAIGLGSILASGGVSDLAYHLKVLPPEAATIAGTVLSAGTAGWTWWRKHKDRKADKNADD